MKKRQEKTMNFKKEHVKQKVGEDSLIESIISVLTLGLWGFISNEVHKREAEKEARKRDCLCAFREDVFPLPYSNEVVHKWRLFDKNHITGKYNIDTGHSFKTVTGYCEAKEER